MKAKTKATTSDRRSVSHQLRQAIEDDGRTAYALGQEAEVDPGMIQRFLNGERGLNLATIDRLAVALGLRLVEAGRGRGRPAKARPTGTQPAPLAPLEHQAEPEATEPDDSGGEGQGEATIPPGPPDRQPEVARIEREIDPGGQIGAIPGPPESAPLNGFLASLLSGRPSAASEVIREPPMPVLTTTCGDPES